MSRVNLDGKGLGWTMYPPVAYPRLRAGVRVDRKMACECGLSATRIVPA